MKEFLKENFWLIFAIIYIVSPIDFIPDILPVLGFTDDIMILIATLIYRFIIYKGSKNKKLNVKQAEIVK